MASFLSGEISWLSSKSEWKSLDAIGMVKSVVIENGKTTEEPRLFITSLTDIQAFSKAVRGHWGIENSLHWVLDVAFQVINVE